MSRLLRAELLKLRTVRVSSGLLMATVAITAFFTSLEARRAGRRVPPISTHVGLATVTTGTGMALVLAAVLGVIMTTGEFRHSTATATYVATPNRSRVLLAKGAAAAILGAGYGVAAGMTATGVGLAFVAGKGDSVTVSTAAIVGHVLGAGAGAALAAVAGVAVGSLVRAQLPAVIGVFLWCLVVESILGAQVTAIRPYLPYTAASTLGGAKLGAAAFGPGYTISSQAALPFIAAAALVAVIACVVATVAARTTVRADIT
jgi:hypothetical protein